MGKIKVKIKLEIGFYDSFFFGGGNGLGEIQSYMKKDIQGLPYISGSALEGSMAAYAAVLSDFFKSGKRRTILFGTGGNAKGILYFENGKLEEKEAYEEMSGQTFGYKTQVSINPYTGTKSYKKLHTIETGGMGGLMRFQSSIHGYMEEETYKEDIAYILATVRMIFALGGRRSSGLGWLNEPIACSVYCGDNRKFPVGEEEIRQWMEEGICM